MGTVRDFAAFIVIGMCFLLVTLSACESSKHAEIMSTEDVLRAKAETGPVPAPEPESAQAGIPFEGKPIESAGLSEPVFSAPEPPPSAAPPPIEEESIVEPAPSAPAPAPPAPEPAPPAPEPAPPAPEPAPPAPEPAPPAPEPAPPAPEPVVEESVAAPEPEPEIAKLESSDFVPEAPVEEKRMDPVPVKESGLQDVFFDFDKYTIRADDFPVLEKNADLLKGVYKDSVVLIEGHCDERGTVEYNLELGKRRAQAVKAYLLDLGIEESRIQIVSYGKEKPFCKEAKPNCWKQNRRGHFVRQ